MKRDLRVARWLAIAALGCTAVACYAKPPERGDAPDAASTCPIAPKSCSVAPSYASDVAPVVERVCVPCHSRGGTAADRDLTTYAHVTRLETTVLTQLSGCLMPPADAGAPLADSDRTLILSWLVCGAPDN